MLYEVFNCYQAMIRVFDFPFDESQTQQMKSVFIVDADSGILSLE